MLIPSPQQKAHEARSVLSGAALVVLILVALLAGCAGQPVTPEMGGGISKAMLLEGKPILKGGSMPAMPDADLLHMTPEMKAFVDFYVDSAGPSAARLLQLQSAIIHNPNFRLDYTSHTFTAADTFKHGYGNCLSFTNLFVAMSRYLGLRAKYQEVDIPITWDHEGGTMVLNRHINIYVKTDQAGRGLGHSTQVIDFNTTDVKDSYDTQRISDRRAAAHYYSNIGIDFLQRGQYRNAFAYMRKGLLIDPTFHDLWINLGALYSRSGALDFAERAYLEAVRHDRSMIALSNLARVYEQMGEPARADQYRREVARFRAKNPYYRFQVARKAIDEGNLGEAVQNLQAAIRLKPAEDEFHFWLGVAYLKLGEAEKARSVLHEAQQLAGDEQLKVHYRNKIKLLEKGATPSALAG